MYNVTLINLDPDARSAGADWEKIERRGISAGDVRALLRNFCELDPVENATAEPEIRVQAPDQSVLVRMGNRKLMVYDMHNRENPAHVLTLDEVMAELDGTAAAARDAAQLAKAMANAAAAVPAASPVPVRPPAPRASLPRMIALALGAAILAGILIWLRVASTVDVRPAGFTRIPAAEAAELQRSLSGVYVTGTQPGQHGIVLTPTGELRLFEFRAIDAPRRVQASGTWGRVGSTLCLATDQPGGLITLSDRNAWVYCGETYRKVP